MRGVRKPCSAATRNVSGDCRQVKKILPMSMWGQPLSASLPSAKPKGRAQLDGFVPQNRPCGITRLVFYNGRTNPVTSRLPMPRSVLQLDSRDNVLIALADLKAGDPIEFENGAR